MTHDLTGKLNETRHPNTCQDHRDGLPYEFDAGPNGLDEFVHELRQPLSTIECLTYYLELVCTDVQTRSHLKRIQDMVMQANHILEEASARQPV